MPPGFSSDITGKIRIAARDIRTGTLHHEAMQIPHVAFGDARRVPGEFANVADGIVMIERFEMILQRLAADGHAFLDYERGFDGTERIAFDGV